MVEMFEESVPTHLSSIDWSCPNDRTSVVACLVKGASVLESARQKTLAPDSCWWTSFNFNLVEKINDESDSSIIGAIYQFTPPSIAATGGAPDYVIAFRGTLIKRKTFLQDLIHDRRILHNYLHKTRRARTALKALQKLLSTYGESRKIWLAGHSLGSSIAMHVGKSMVESGVYLETFLFNPPYTDVPIESLITSERVKRGVRIAGSFARAGMAALMDGQEEKCNDYFDKLTSWVPHIFVNRGDVICAEYEGYFGHRKVMEDIGAEEIGTLATKISLRVLFRSAVGLESEPLHLLPSAMLIVNLNEYPGPFASHRIKQWWGPELCLDSKEYSFPNSTRSGVDGDQSRV